MSKFIRNLLLLTLLYAATIAASMCITRYLILRSNVFQLPADVSVIALGDSQIECGLDDSRSSHFINLAHSAESYFYSYHKLAVCLEENPQLKTVVLGLGRSSFSANLDRRWLFESSHFLARFASHWVLWSPAEACMFATTNFSDVLLGTLRSPRFMVSTLLQSLRKGLSAKNLGYGGFVRLRESKLAEAIQLYEPPTAELLFTGTKQIEYFDLIVNLCATHEVDLCLVSPPLHNFETHQPHSLQRKEATQDFLENQYPALRRVDVSEIAIPDSCYRDLAHLTEEGAKLFTAAVLDSLEMQQ